VRGLRLSGGQYRRLLVTNGSVAVGPKWLESSSTTPTKEVGDLRRPVPSPGERSTLDPPPLRTSALDQKEAFLARRRRPCGLPDAVAQT